MRHLSQGVQSLGELLYIPHDPEASHRVWVVERVGSSGDRKGGLWSSTSSNLQQGFASLFREMAGDVQQAVLIRLAQAVQPLDWNAVAQQLIIQHSRCWTRLRWYRALRFDEDGDLNLPDSLLYLDDLHRAGTGMGLHSAAMRPLVGVVVVVDVAQRHAVARLVDDYADVLIHTGGSKAAVPGSLNAVHPESGAHRIGLQIEHCRLDCCLLARAQLREARCKRGGDPELHQSTRNTLSTSSPRWLMTLTAMRPESGLSKGRDVSLWSVAQASASISALRVVFSDL